MTDEHIRGADGTIVTTPNENFSTTRLVLGPMNRRERAYGILPLVIVLATLFSLSACRDLGFGVPSTTECIARWNRSGNHQSQTVVAETGFPLAHVAGWPTKAGDHCSATFFTRPGEPWVMFVLWVDAPEPRMQFTRDIGGSRYGRGQLGAESPIPANGEVEEDGTLMEQ